MRHTTRSNELYKEALQHIVGGVNSPSRSYQAVQKEYPIFMKSAKGAYFWDEDGNQYIDYLAAYGPLICGHAHPHITEAITRAANQGVLYGTPTEYEITFAKMLKSAMPGLEKVRFVNSGTEAVMTCIRVARAYTKRNKILKFAGCYHGHSDLVLVAAGSGPATLGVPDSAGVPASIAQDVITVPFNDPQAFIQALEKFGDELAGILVEPVVGNFGIVTPNPGFLKLVSNAAKEHGILVIYDEVITAFRFHYGGIQNMQEFTDGVTPDLTALGKIIGGGLPIGAYGGKKEIMEQVAPLGPAYQAGTMAGNPLSISAGIACLEVLKAKQAYDHLDNLGQELEVGLRAHAKKYGVPITLNRVKGAFSLHFCDHPITNYEESKASSSTQFATFFNAMLDQGVLLAPSKYEAWFLTLAHETKDIERTLHAADYAFSKVATTVKVKN